MNDEHADGLVIGATGKTGHYTVPEFMIPHFCAVALDYQNGIFSGEGTMIAELTGKPPMTAAGAAGHNNTSGEHHSGQPSERQGGANVWEKSGFVGVLQSALRGIRAFEEALERTPYDDLYDRVRHLEARSLHSMHSSPNRGWEPMSKQGLPQ